MIPAKFDYERAGSVDEALELLGRDDAKLLAGGHSLLPLMKLRLAAPTLLVDIRKVPGLRGVQRENGQWRIGAMAWLGKRGKAGGGVIIRTLETVWEIYEPDEMRNRIEFV